MPLWSNFRSTAREKPGLRGLIDVMDGTMMIVDDDRDFRLWGGMLEENWDQVGDKAELFNTAELEFFGRASTLLQKILNYSQ